MVTQRAASLVARVLAVGIVLGPRQPSAQPGALLQRGIQRVERVGAELADLDLAEHRADGAADPVHNPVHAIERNCSICGFYLEPPIGIEPMAYALRVRRSDRLS